MVQAGQARFVTIMIADDSDDLRELVAIQLQRLGYKVIEAKNGEEAINLARQTKPDLILMDISMPVLDGLSASRMIRETEQLRDTAIVAFSAYLSGGNRQQALDAGCNAYLSKRDYLDELKSLLRQFAPLT